MALLTPEEDDHFEEMIFENAANHFLEVKRVSPTLRLMEEDWGHIGRS